MLPANAKVFYYSNSRKHFDNQGILLYGRRVSDSIVYNFYINDFFPYFAVPVDEENMKKIIELENKKVIIKHEMYVNEDTKETYHDQFKNPVVVIFTRSTKDHTTARAEFEKTFEDDVIYERVFRKTKNIYGFFAIPEIETVLKRKTIKIERKGHIIDTLYYTISHILVYGF